MGNYLRIGVSYLKNKYYPHLLLTFVFSLASSQLMSFRNLQEFQSARVLEMYACFEGVFLMTPLFMPEQDRELWMLERSKKTSMWKVYLTRLLPAVICAVGIVSVFLVILNSNSSQVQMTKMWMGAVSEILFLGSIGFFVSAVTNQVVLGYMLAVIYYAVNIGGSKYLGKLALFQMGKGQYGFYIWMFPMAILLYVGGIWLREKIAYN